MRANIQDSFDTRLHKPVIFWFVFGGKSRHYFEFSVRDNRFGLGRMPSHQIYAQGSKRRSEEALDCSLAIHVYVPLSTIDRVQLNGVRRALLGTRGFSAIGLCLGSKR